MQETAAALFQDIFYPPEYPSHGILHPMAYLIDWDKAEQIIVPVNTGVEESVKLWPLFLEVGFAPERVLELVDPAIIPILRRILNLPMLTLWSCSGHPHEGYGNPYLGVVFRDRKFGVSFMDALKDVFTAEKGITFGSEGPGISTENIPFSVLPSMPVEFAVEYYLPVMLRWHIKDDEDIFKVWRLFSSALHRFDSLGEFIPDPEALLEHAVDYEIPGAPLPESFLPIHERITGRRFRRRFIDRISWWFRREKYQ